MNNPLKREIIRTADGSTTIHLPDWDENYHSKHGAIQEAKHVFIKNGLSLFGQKSISIMEIGFGTGLNAFITYLESEKQKFHIDYVGIEGFPVTYQEAFEMNFIQELGAEEHSTIFAKMHVGNWEEKSILSDFFSLTKRKQLIESIDDIEKFDLIYFDAFGYRVQPELWSTAIFQRMYNALKPGGLLVTYAARGVVKRSMIEVGFVVEKLDGPPGKREMFRARKGR